MGAAPFLDRFPEIDVEPEAVMAPATARLTTRVEVTEADAEMAAAAPSFLAPAEVEENEAVIAAVAGLAVPTIPPNETSAKAM
jgi:hypothetical protein